MTEKEMRQYYVDTAKRYFGKREGSTEHKFIIDTYNAQKPLPRGYKVQYTDDWCATFVSAIAILCGYGKIIPAECSCGQQISAFQNLGAWVENDAYVPNVGDIIYYDWQDNGSGDNGGWADHVGIVESVNGKTIRVIEGNNGDAVNYRTVTVNQRYIRGYGVPKYASMATAAKVETAKPIAKSETELAKEWAINNGIFKGDGNGNYTWNAPVTREQVAIILYRLENKQK